MHLKEVHINWSPMSSSWRGTLIVKLPTGEVSVPLGHEQCREILATTANSLTLITACSQVGVELQGVCKVESELFDEDPFR